MLKLIIMLVILFNILTAWVVGNLKGKFKIRVWHNQEVPMLGENAVLIAGFRNQPEVAFSLIDFSKYSWVIYLRYSNFGFNMKQATKQLQDKFIVKPDDEVFAISFGAKIAQYAGIKKCVLINPCISPEAIQEPYRRKFKRKAIIYGALKAILGWLAFIPIITVEKPANYNIALKPVKYSLALLADQMYYIGFGEPKISESRNITLVLSHFDWLLDNEYIFRTFHKAQVVFIRAGHADTLKNPGPYRKALEPLLE